MGWRRRWLLLPAALATTGLAQVAGPIEIGPSWGTAASDGQSASLFTTLVNHGVLPDRLAGVSCPGFGTVSETGIDPATEGPGPTDKGVLVPRGGRADMTPDGPHLALADLPRPIRDGALVPCTLRFVRTGERVVVFSIGAPGLATSEP